MKVFAAAEAKNAFGRMIDIVQREPVTVEKKGRAVAVIMSIEEYKRLEQIENDFWGSKALAAEQEGFIGKEKSADLMRRLLDARN